MFDNNTPVLYSFNNIISSAWEDLANKRFTRIDTNAYLGNVYAKYDNLFSLSAICTNGRVEFFDYDKNNYVRIFGEDIDVNAPLFAVL